jgi:drug/metabolite transporter (DMT)-like permease
MSSGALQAGKGRAMAALLLLCVLWALDGLAPDLFPALRRAPLPVFERLAITHAVLAVAAAAFAVKVRAGWPGIKAAFSWCGVGLLLFAAPAILVFAGQGWVPQLERVAIFSLTPLFAVVLEPHLGNVQQPANRSLIAALIGFAGALAIFPLSVPGSPVAALAVLAVLAAAVCVAVGNCTAIRMACTQPEVSLAAIAALAAGASAAVFAAVGIFTEGAHWQMPHDAAELIWILVVDVPALVLLFWLFRRMSAAQMTARYLIAPWLTILAGIALERPTVTMRMALGVVLLGIGAGWLLSAPETETSGERIEIL